jgi:hypothetical protein
VLLMPLTALPLLVLAVLLTIRLAHGLPILLLATKMFALVPSLLAKLHLKLDAPSLLQLVLPPMPVACLKPVVLVLSSLLAQTDTSLLSALPSSLSFSLSDDLKRYDFFSALHISCVFCSQN